MKHSISGQSLIELLVALAIGAIVVSGVIFTLGVSLRSGGINRNFQTASGLAQETIDTIRSVATGNWHSIYNLQKGSTAYYATSTGGFVTIATGTQTTDVNGVSYTTFFYVNNVCRDALQNIVPCGSGEDPGTQEITAYVRWTERGDTAEAKVIDYVTRFRNATFRQTDWSGGTASGTILTDPENTFATSSNINITESGSLKIEGIP